MKCPNRAAERRPEIIESLKRIGGYSHIIDMSGHEKRGHYFEGTGEQLGGSCCCAAAGVCVWGGGLCGGEGGKSGG
jgi:hypothetical protein